jgi:hypothetical protein
MGVRSLRTLVVFMAPLRAAPTERKLDLANIVTESSLSMSVLHDR